MNEIMSQAGIQARDVCRTDASQTDLAFMHATASLLEGLPRTVIDTVMASIEISRGTQELIQTLKSMGYKIGLISTGFDVFADALGSRLGLDYARGFELPMDDDSLAVIGDLPAGLMKDLERPGIIEGVMRQERVDQEDITIISDRDIDYATTPGIRLMFSMKVMLDLMNRHALSRDSLTGLLRSFGIPQG